MVKKLLQNLDMNCLRDEVTCEPRASFPGTLPPPPVTVQSMV